MTDMENLPYHRKYRPNTLAKYIGNEKLKETAMKALSSGKRPQVILLWGDSGCGKAQPLNSLVLTINGYKRMGDIKVGDEVFTHNGNRGRVSGIYPQGIRPIYRIHLSDCMGGDEVFIDVSDEHLNCVCKLDACTDIVEEELVLTTNELIARLDNEDFCVARPNFEFEDLPITEKYIDSMTYIPDCYKYNSREVRTNLLEKICDCEDRLYFSTKYETLYNDVKFIAQSLGYAVRKDCKPSSSNDNFSLVFADDEDTYGFWNIDSIERIEDQECQCIMIDHPDHTYISDFFIPTHNTTFARLLAKEYSCEDRNEETGACGKCISCQTIDEYIATGDTSLLSNIQEIDITDQSGKKDLDSVLADMEMPAFGDEWKIFIFDECHMATPALQNRLLKIAEEPPEHVLMLFCTTNPEKLIETLKNRCQLKLHVTKPKVKELAGLLRYVCSSEGVEYDNQGLEFIANRGELTIRTALTNLQQVVTEQNSAKYENAIQVFDAVSSTIIINFFRALKAKDVFRYVTLLYEIKSKMDLNVFVNELAGFVQRGIYTINGIQLEGVSDNELKVYRDLFGDMGVAQINVLLTKVLNLNPKNLEMELLLLGYTGLDTKTDDSEDKGVFDTVIPNIDNELGKEVATTNKVLKEKADIAYEQGVENAKNFSSDASIEALMAMGGILVE